MRVAWLASGCDAAQLRKRKNVDTLRPCFIRASRLRDRRCARAGARVRTIGSTSWGAPGLRRGGFSPLDFVGLHKRSNPPAIVVATGRRTERPAYPVAERLPGALYYRDPATAHCASTFRVYWDAAMKSTGPPQDSEVSAATAWRQIHHAGGSWSWSGLQLHEVETGEDDAVK
jgi:hypothetical protein